MLKAFSGIEYYYSPASYINKNAFIIISIFSLKMLNPDDAVMLLKKASNDINSFIKRNHCNIMQQKTQRMFGKDCIATLIDSNDDDIEQNIVDRLKAKIYYHTKFDK